MLRILNDKIEKDRRNNIEIVIYLYVSNRLTLKIFDESIRQR